MGLSSDIPVIVALFIGAAVILVWHLTVMRNADRSAADTQRELATAQERSASLLGRAASAENELRNERARAEELNRRLLVAEKNVSQAQTALVKEREAFDKERSGIAETRNKYRIYGRLDCPSALSHIAKGHYVRFRVFFKDEETATAAGFRPCGKCLPEKYKAWKAAGGKDAA